MLFFIYNKAASESCQSTQLQINFTFISVSTLDHMPLIHVISKNGNFEKQFFSFMETTDAFWCHSYLFKLYRNKRTLECGSLNAALLNWSNSKLQLWLFISIVAGFTSSLLQYIVHLARPQVRNFHSVSPHISCPFYIIVMREWLQRCSSKS